MQLVPLLEGHQCVKSRSIIMLLHCKHPVYGTSSLPVAEIISSDHGTAEITHFLNKWVLTCKAILHKGLRLDPHLNDRKSLD